LPALENRNMKKIIIGIVILLAAGFFAFKFFTASEKADLIRVEIPRPNAIISSPLVVKGRARGFWFFEASFPIRLYDANGVNIPLNPPYIMATTDWMTEEFVPFLAELEFQNPATETGVLVLEKDNPSGLPEQADELRIPVRFDLTKK